VTEQELLPRVRDLLPAMTERAAALDEAGAFPTDDIAALTQLGALSAPLPRHVGGLGLGTEPAGAAGILALLRLLGQANLAIGRVYEAHVNAIRLIARYGNPTLLAATAADVQAGCLFALWVTDPPDGGLTLMPGNTLRGRKQFCSAAGHAQRAVVTARDLDGRFWLAVVSVDDHVAVTPLAGGMQGVRAATTGQVSFPSVASTPFGRPGDYLREPDFSTGAWRTSAVTLGGLDALLAEATRQLRARGRLDDPHQQARMGRALIAGDTARLWLQEAAPRAEDADATPDDAIATVHFARLAVEQACLDAITLVQRSLGVAAFVRPNPAERLCRDLATYLRQPAPDETLAVAAAHRLHAMGDGYAR
jgi:alkylation response protein AidB-like acyl-CoA dehydrogenase